LTDSTDRSNIDLSAIRQAASEIEMNIKVAPKQDTKVVLIEAGMQAMFERGYTNTGIQEVLSTVGIPKGSFYHYFNSKEDFALAIINQFDEFYTAKLTQYLRDQSVSPLIRLKNYSQGKIDMLAAWKCRKGCLIGNLSMEMADQSEILRQALSHVMGKWRDLFAACIAEGQQTGEIRRSPDAEKLAELFLDSLEGAVMRAKTFKSVQPLDAFVESMFDYVLLP
jgi:TetR/AcrR family transcriptional repressor of nem operon